jgi:hypothetical protein
MERRYRYHLSVAQIVFGSVIVGFISTAGWMCVLAGWKSRDISNRLLGIGLGALCLTIAIVWLSNVSRKFLRIYPVTTSSSGLKISTLFTTKSILWEDITEFGTYRRLAGRVFIRCFYLKTKQDDREIRLCTDSLENVNDLIDVMFQTAKDARFVRIENIGAIPFIKKIQITLWDRGVEL